MNPPSNRLLILRLERLSDASRARVLQLARHLGCPDAAEWTFELQTDSEPNLRAVTALCAEEGGAAWLLAKLPKLPQADDVYRRLVDHSEHYAEAIDAWRRGHVPLPALLPGEMIRLA